MKKKIIMLFGVAVMAVGGVLTYQNAQASCVAKAVNDGNCFDNVCYAGYGAPDPCNILASGGNSQKPTI